MVFERGGDLAVGRWREVPQAEMARLAREEFSGFL